MFCSEDCFADPLSQSRQWTFPRTARTPVDEAVHNLVSGEALVGMDVLVRLCVEDENNVALISEHSTAIPSLIDLLDSQSNRARALESMRVLSRHELIADAIILKGKGVKSLVRLLSDPPVQLSAAKTISRLIEGSELRQKRLSEAYNILYQLTISATNTDDKEEFAMALCRVVEGNLLPSDLATLTALAKAMLEVHAIFLCVWGAR